MKIASLIAGAIAFGGGLINFSDAANGAHGSYVAAFFLCLVGFLLLTAGFIGRQKQHAK